ncbi:hypothetical protein J4H29_05000 [Vibrio alginolyticus]|uniref:hypothetical protein n=1 Tax=Vibrio alginolyticus TaxID=663 RepID=UPI001BD39A1B|nr:hypothetical protein [Vibrio alginolyticus]MBT0024075.1 hypothetical protein [Vibrio alginolyticus]
MSNPKKKYLSDYAVNLCSSRWLMFPASNLMSGDTWKLNSQQVLNNCHIYIICKRPKLSFSPETFHYDGEFVSGHLVYKVSGIEQKIEFSMPFPLLDGAVQVCLGKYPYREFSTLSQEGEEVRYMPAFSVGAGLGLHLNYSDLRDLEVLYVGQAFGDGSRNVIDRLKNHSTLQKILAQSQYDDPDSETLLITVEYPNYKVLSFMDSRAENVITGHHDYARFKSILETPLTKHQQVCLTEAALIRYFQPKYNQIYKDNFPSKKHKILASCYNLDFSGLIVEINTDELGFALFSSTVRPSGHHICNIDILDPNKRLGFFHYSRGDGSLFEMPNVIRPKG